MREAETDALDAVAAASTASAPTSTAATPPPPPPAPSSSSARGGDAGGQPSYPPLPPADVVVASRCGDVLTRATLLKSDHFPGCQNRRLRPLVEGAPNFRRVPGLPVFGVAIPTAAGLRRALEAAGAGPGAGAGASEEEEGREGGEAEGEGGGAGGGGGGGRASPPKGERERGRRKVLWHNLREEPVIYINGRPFVVRDAAAPFANLEYTGIDRARVEDMEARLRADVLREAAAGRGGAPGAVLVAHEGPDFAVVEEWEPVTDADVQTPADVYRVRGSFCFEAPFFSPPLLSLPRALSSLRGQTQRGKRRFSFFLSFFPAHLFPSPPKKKKSATPRRRSSSPTAMTSTTSECPSPTRRPPRTRTSTSCSPAAGAPLRGRPCSSTARWAGDARRRGWRSRRWFA